MGKVPVAVLTVTGVPVGESVVAGDLVGFDTAEHKLVRAYGGSGGPVPAVGVAAAAYQAGDEGAFHLVGEVSGLVGLTVGAVVYLSLTAAGGTQSGTPSGAGNLKQVVGRAVAADRIMVRIEPATTL